MTGCATYIVPRISCAEAPPTSARRSARCGVSGAAPSSSRSGRVRIVALRDGERYRDRSPSLVRLGIDVDGWPAPRPVSPSSRNAPFIRASMDDDGGARIRSRAPSRARRRRLPSPASIRESSAPSPRRGASSLSRCQRPRMILRRMALRAYVEVNDPASPWPAAPLKRLQAVDSHMLAVRRRDLRNALRRSARARHLAGRSIQRARPASTAGSAK